MNESYTHLLTHATCKLCELLFLLKRMRIYTKSCLVMLRIKRKFFSVSMVGMRQAWCIKFFFNYLRKVC